MTNQKKTPPLKKTKKELGTKQKLEKKEKQSLASKKITPQAQGQTKEGLKNNLATKKETFSKKAKVIFFPQEKKQEGLSSPKKRTANPFPKILKFTPKLQKDIRLVWLYCTKCKQYQYTALITEVGRTHKPCGEKVLEFEVPLLACLEMVMLRHNLSLAKNLAKEVRKNLDSEAETEKLAYIRTIESSMGSYQEKILQAYQNQKNQTSPQKAAWEISQKVEEKPFEEWVEIGNEEGFLFDQFGFCHSPFFLIPFKQFQAN